MWSAKRILTIILRKVKRNNYATNMWNNEIAPAESDLVKTWAGEVTAVLAN